MKSSQQTKISSVKELRYLISDFNKSDNIEHMSASQFWDVSVSLQKTISKKDLERIFSYAKEHYSDRDIKSRPEPLVANYANRLYAYSFRRWVDRVVRELNIQVNKPKYHDTKLTGNGHWIPSAQDMEDIISIGYNNINNIEVNEAITTKQKLLEDYYKDNRDVIDAIASKIRGDFDNNSSLGKLSGSGIHATIQWKDRGGYADIKEINNVPKTDIISKDNNIRISLKSSVGSQLMSASYHEAKATIITAIKKSNCEHYDKAKRLIDLLDNEWVTCIKSVDGIAKIKKDKNHPYYREVIAAEENANNIQALLNELISENKDFEYELLYEASTGETKFGKNSKSSANCFLIWNEDNPDESIFCNPKDFIEHIIHRKIKYIVNFKSANSRSWQNMRIICL